MRIIRILFRMAAWRIIRPIVMMVSALLVILRFFGSVSPGVCYTAIISAAAAIVYDGLKD